MRSAARAIAVVAILGFVSCTSSTEPNVYLAEMTQIDVPPMVDANGGLAISFSFSFGGCDRLERVQAEQREGGLLFAVRIRRASSQNSCPAIIYERSVQYSLLPAAPLPLSVTFRQPTGDVVYTVVAFTGGEASTVTAQLTPPDAAQ